MAEYGGRNVVAEYWQGQVSLRELRVMVSHLPPDSAAHRAALGHDWTCAVHWNLADARDLLADLLVLTFNANRDPGRSTPLEPIARAVRPGMGKAAQQEAQARAAEESHAREAHERIAAMVRAAQAEHAEHEDEGS